MSSNFDKVNIAFIGDIGVGKTTMINRYRTGEFKMEYVPTFGVEKSTITFGVYDKDGDEEKNKRNIQVECFDMSGENSLPINFSEMHGVVLMFDLTNKNSYINLEFWMAKCPQEIPIILLGNKNDSINRRVPPKDGFFS